MNTPIAVNFSHPSLLLDSPVKKKNKQSASITEMPLVLRKVAAGDEKNRHHRSALLSVSHEELVSNGVVFMEALRSFHVFFSTRFMVPVIGGKDLDLHLLYVEVTKRGGFQKVVEEKKWRDLSKVFEFPQTATSVSYVLRKHYLSILYQFEQLYFFQAKTPLIHPTSVLAIKSPTSRAPTSVTMESASTSMQIPPQQIQTGVSKCSTTVKGKLEGKFEYGYLVSVKMGTEVLRGVLYYPVVQQISSAKNVQPCTAIIPYKTQPSLQVHSSRKRRRRKRLVDPARPKTNRSGYNFFFSEKHSMLKSLYPNREREFTKIIGESWNKLGDDEKMIYQEIGMKDKERYMRELKEYKERMKMETGKVV